ncbi:hypothetical protein GCM10028857_07740 [Salinarchaeum chitinilyticum]
MTDALVVHLNRSEHHAIEPASDSFETDGPFVVRIQNHGEGSHMHCSLSGDLASTATVTEGNPFLEPEDVVEVPVDVRTDLRPARGTLELSTGYGRESVAIGVLVRESSNVPTSPIERDSDGEDAGATKAGGTERDAVAASGGATTGDTAVGNGDSVPVLQRASKAIDDAVDAVTPRRDAGTGLLAGLALVALLIAVLAWQFVEGAVVRLAVLVVLATVIGAAGVLLRR